ncbi:hypothetical protein CAPTEDRAFT_101660 [Capitella teleta]|uniref:Uncharacterized protein n=1 Tax=Capitella teleta TaxID=283909 RepID=R7TTX2_CAPTE|nr:hypothetical protein CAPTEDRAFT_101660 [Capitella teleta]|eukprot:ELT94906.1 hypothetical protein CAPTEDRAFT_101660 [Capitella teleta]
MANTGLDLLLKMNNKLEAFLKRNLDVDCVERIRTYEACIVCSERDDKAFKYVVLSDEWLYLAENPPKKLEETVHLRDIVSIQLVSDFPAFLSGEERENTQHIVVTYVTVEASKTMKKKQNDLRSLNIPKTPRSSRGISARSSLSASGHSTARDLLKRDRQFSSFSARELSDKERRRLFSELKKEILDAGDDMEKTFSVVSELRDGVERKFRLKKLFWKTPELFDYLIKQLLHYLPESSNPQATINDDEAKKLRADELDLAILLAEAIAVMFRETEIVPTRITSLNSGAGSVVGKLLFAMTTQPKVPQKGNRNEEVVLVGCLFIFFYILQLAKLVQEFTNTATSVLFELILIAQQVRSDLNILISITFQLIRSPLFNYVERMVAHIMRLLSPSQFDELPPLSVVLVFQQFTVLQCFMEYSPNITKFVRKHFYEEFKYYIQTPILKKKIPSRYPLTPYIFRLIETVVSEVLQKPRQIKS